MTDLVPVLAHLPVDRVGRELRDHRPAAGQDAEERTDRTATQGAGNDALELGHPLGASGSRLFTTLLNALEASGGRYGLQTMCEAGGMANALIVERI